MSSELEAAFRTARDRVESLPERPGNADLLRLYAHYKQATEGDCAGERPGAFDFVKRAKFDAWAALRGMNPQAAMQAYIDLIDSLS